MSSTYETVSEKDLPHEFSYPVDDNVLTVRRTDPYGFWVFSFKRGRLPPELEGNFSTDSKARIAADVYLKNRVPERPVIKYKTVKE